VGWVFLTLEFVSELLIPERVLDQIL